MYFLGETMLRDVPAGEYYLLLLSGILGIGIADTLFLWSLNLLGAGLQSIINCLYSPSIILLSYLWLRESMSILQAVGVVMIVLAVLGATFKKSRQSIGRRDMILGLVLGVIATTASAFGIVMIKGLLERSPLLWVTEIRLLGGIMALAVVLLLNPRRGKIMATIYSRQSRVYTISGSFFGAYLAMMLWLGGMKFTTASVASALNQTSSVFIFVFAAFLLREPINLQRVMGIILGISGAFLVTFG
jgi:drug/metabolite transporter (DMT)-like permease